MASLRSTYNSSSSSEQNMQEEQMMMDQKKRKRMQSNRESARRSRMRKQRHLDDLTAQIAQLSHENNQIVTSISVTMESYVNVEAENSILRAQVMELAQRLNSLHEILKYMNGSSSDNQGIGVGDDLLNSNNNNNNPWDFAGLNHQHPVMASSAVTFDY